MGLSGIGFRHVGDRDVDRLQVLTLKINSGKWIFGFLFYTFSLKVPGINEHSRGKISGEMESLGL